MLWGLVLEVVTKLQRKHQRNINDILTIKKGMKDKQEGILRPAGGDTRYKSSLDDRGEQGTTAENRIGEVLI